MNNQDILDELNKTVYGHIRAKKVLINAVNRSKKRYLQYYKYELPETDLIPNLSCLLIGESGTGKTFLIEELARIMKFPYIKFDMSQLSTTANKSDFNIESLINDIRHYTLQVFKSPLTNYHSPHGVAAQTIVFLDEFDKLGIDCYTGPWYRKIQSEILTLLENKGEYRHLTFILAGAFSNLDLRQKTTKHIGFEKKQSFNTSESIDLDNELITKGNIITEVLGRINILAQLDSFTEDEYTIIFKTHIFPQFNNQLIKLGFSGLEISEEEQTILIAKAYKSGLGIRAIKRELMNRSIDLEFNDTALNKEECDTLMYLAGGV